MKTNLDSQFKTDKKKECEGVWCWVSGEEVGFLVKRFGNYNSPEVKKAMTLHSSKYSKQIADGTLTPEQNQEITVKSFVDACVIGWKGIEIDGAFPEFTKELCVEVFTQLPDVFEIVSVYSLSIKNFKADLGNS